VTGTPTKFKIEVEFLAKLRTHGPAAKLASLRSVQASIAKPARKWRGLNRANQADGFAIMSRPSQRYFDVGENDHSTTPDGTCFFVYCSGDLVIHDWDWVDFCKEVSAEKSMKPDGTRDTKTAENTYCSQAFQVELLSRN
jgi:hypothetical protein